MLLSYAFHFFLQVLVGVRFLRYWPYIGRLRVCFAEPPYFQMNVKAIFSHGLDVTELPGIAGWLVIIFHIFLSVGFLNSHSLSIFFPN